MFAIHALQLNPDIGLDDLKAQAGLHGIRVTAASVTAARRQLAPASQETEAGAGSAALPKQKRQPKRRAAPAPLDVEELIRQTVAKVQGQGEVEAERMRDAVRGANTMLESALVDAPV